MQQFYTAINRSTLFWLRICCSEIQWVLNVTAYRRFTVVLHDYIFNLWSYALKHCGFTHTCTVAASWPHCQTVLPTGVLCYIYTNLCNHSLNVWRQYDIFITLLLSHVSSTLPCWIFVFAVYSMQSVQAWFLCACWVALMWMHAESVSQYVRSCVHAWLCIMHCAV